MRRTPHACGGYPGSFTAVVQRELTTERQRSRLAPSATAWPGKRVEGFQISSLPPPSPASLQASCRGPRVQRSRLRRPWSALATHSHATTRRWLGPRDKPEENTGRDDTAVIEGPAVIQFGHINPSAVFLGLAVSELPRTQGAALSNFETVAGSRNPFDRQHLPMAGSSGLARGKHRERSEERRVGKECA